MPTNVFAFILYFLKPQTTKVIGLIIIATLLGSIQAIDATLLKAIANDVEQLINNPDANVMAALGIWMIGYAVWWELINVTWRLYDYLYMRAIPQIKVNIVGEFYDYIQNHSNKFFQENMIGSISTRVLDASKSFEWLFTITNERIYKKTVVIITSLAAMYMVHKSFAYILFTWLIFFIGTNLFFSKKINRYSMNIARSRATAFGKIVDSISNVSAIRMFNHYEHEKKYLSSYLQDNVNKERTLQWFMFKLRYLQGTSCSVLIFFLFYLLISMKQAGEATVGDFVMILTLAISVADEVWDLTQDLSDFFEEIGVIAQALTLITPYDIQESPDSHPLMVTEGKIEFRDVTFRYKQDDNLFSEKTITINGKEKVGLVGFSGSGKTTFIQLITRIHDINEGSIAIDGQDIKKVTLQSLRDNIGFIPQDPLLFDRTIKENIAYGKLDASDEEIIEAAKKAHIHDFIINLPDRYDTMCGEKGSNLSGGQRQRVAIARAILKNAPILVLDEATSALDSLTENLIQSSLEQLMENKTVLVIAHRLSTLLNMDRILVFDRGTIVEDGDHETLIKSDYLYSKLWQSQIGGFIAKKPKK